MYYKEIFIIILIFVIGYFFILPTFLNDLKYKKQQKINALAELHKQNVNYNRHINKLHYDNYITYLNDLKSKENTNKVLQSYVDPPEFIKLNNLLFEFTLHNKWDNIIATGDIYKNGAYPRFKRDKETALECYKIAARSPDSDVAGIAQLKYIETLSENDMDMNDDMGDHLPRYFAHDICNMAQSIINNTPYNDFTRPKNKQNTNGDDIVHTFTRNRTTRGNRVTDRTTNRTTDRTTHAYKNDLQNVHDHSVTNIIKKNLTILKESDNNITKRNNNITNQNNNITNQNNNITNQNDDITKIVSDDSTKRDVLYSILEHPKLSESIKGSAVVVLENLNNKEKHGTFNVTEEEALSLVWNRMNNEKDDIKKSNMIEILAKQLDSSIENGYIVCSSGKIARIIGALDGIDEEMTSSRPIWAIREEIGNLAGKIMNGNYKNPQDEFKRQVQKTYIDELKLDSNIINPIITEYIDHL